MYFQVDERSIHYQLDNFSSDDPDHTIVLIHGLGQDLRSWDYILPYLTNYRIIRYDIAGHGFSGIPANGIYHIHTFSDELSALLNHLKVKNVTLYGYELGACIATHFAGRYPEIAAQIITVAHPVYYPEEFRRKIFDQRFSEMQAKGMQGFLSDHLPSITYHDTLDTLKYAYLNVSMNTYEAIMKILKTGDLIGDYKRNYQPVLQLVGDMDSQYPPQLLFHAMQYFPAPILVQIPNAKSLVHIDNPEYTAQRVDTFIKNISSLSSPIAREASHYYAAMIKKRNEHTGIEYQMRIDVIHRFEARINGRLLTGNWKIRKAQELIIFLLVHKVVMREKLYDLFWPHLNLENAQNMLRVSINHLKKLIDKPYGTSFIQSKRDRIELTGNVESDLLELLKDMQTFLACHDVKEKEMIARRIGRAVTPALLEDYYNDWILNLREEILNAAAPIIKWTAAHYETQNRLLDSILYYKLMLKILPDEVELIQKIAGLYESLQLKGLAREWHERYEQASAYEE